MRTFSVNNGKLVLVRKNDIEITPGPIYYVHLKNIIIDGVTVAMNNDFDQVAVIHTDNGKVSHISFYKNGIHTVSEHILGIRSKLPDHNLASVRFDQSFTDWFETVKNTGVTPFVKFDFIDGKVVVDKDGEIITHEVGYVYSDEHLRYYIPGSSNTIFFDKPFMFGCEEEIIGFTDGKKTHFFYTTPKTTNFTEAFKQWRESHKGKLINSPRTMSVVNKKLVVQDNGRVYEYEIGDTYIDRQMKFRNTNADTTIFIDTAMNGSGAFNTIYLYRDGGIMRYYIDPLIWDFPEFNRPATDLDQSFIDWYNAIKAMPEVV